MMQITRQAKPVEYDELDTARGMHPAHIACSSCNAKAPPPTPLYFSFSFCFQIPYENEIFIGRLCFRYISWIVINFIDNCHILMAWLCAWLSDCCNAPVVAAAVVATCVAYAHSEQFFFLFLFLFFCFNSCAPFLVSFFHFFVANCFQRKLLHAQSYEQTERERERRSRSCKGAGSIYNICMYIGQAGRHLLGIDCASGKQCARHVKNSMRQSERCAKIRKSLLMEWHAM